MDSPDVATLIEKAVKKFLSKKKRVKGKMEAVPQSASSVNTVVESVSDTLHVHVIEEDIEELSADNAIKALGLVEYPDTDQDMSDADSDCDSDLDMEME